MAEDGSPTSLFEAAKAVRANAHAPYSGFKVGAALRAASGAIYSGCNVENAAYPEGWCAETSAIAQLVAAGETAIAEVLVLGAGERPLTPCGGCRQRLAEFAGPTVKVHSAGPDGIRRTFSLGELLPEAFALDGAPS